MADKKKSLAAVLEEREREVIHLENHITQLRRENDKLRITLADNEQFAKKCAAATVATKPVKFRKATSSKSKSKVAAVLKFSDWHIGEVISSEEVEGFNEFNYAIACQRVDRIVNRFVRWVNLNRSQYDVDEIVVFCEGDYVSGDIHHELIATNEFPLPEQAAKAGRLMGEALLTISEHTDNMVVYMVGADNHGRLVRKPQAKQKSSNNMSYVVHEIACGVIARQSHIHTEIAKGSKLLADVKNYKFLIEHGDNIRGQMGIPYYGFARNKGKEAVRRMNTEKGFHFQSIGHFHVPAIIEGATFVNGSLSGTSEFDHGQGRHAEPSQVAFLVGSHGIFNWVPFHGNPAK